MPISAYKLFIPFIVKMEEGLHALKYLKELGGLFLISDFIFYMIK
jgi:hypothetical protein